MDNHDSTKIDAVFFDMDGVLIDSSFYHYLAWRHVFLNIVGWDIDEALVYENEGRKAKEIFDILVNSIKYFLPTKEFDVDTIIEERRKWYRKNAKPVVYYDAFPVIRQLRECEIKTAIVTSSSIDSVNFSLNKYLQSHFDHIVADKETLKAKASGEMYSYACYAVNTSPDRCLVIENSPLGILAAKDAGTRCVAVETTMPKSLLHEADWIIKDVTNLPELLNAEDLW